MYRPSLLVVEDERIMNRLLVYSLSKYYNVRSAFDGQEALGLIAAEVPDLILSDLMMPVMDGLSLLNTLRNDLRYRHIPFVVVTAKDDEKSRRAIMEAGADEYITKPFFLPVILSAIDGLLQASTERLAS